MNLLHHGPALTTAVGKNCNNGSTDADNWFYYFIRSIRGCGLIIYTTFVFCLFMVNAHFVFVPVCYLTYWIVQHGLTCCTVGAALWLAEVSLSFWVCFEGCPCVSLIKIYQCCGQWAGQAEALRQALTHSTLSGKDSGCSVKWPYILLCVAWLWLMMRFVDCTGLKYYSTDYQQYVCNGRLTCVRVIFPALTSAGLER